MPETVVPVTEVAEQDQEAPAEGVLAVGTHSQRVPQTGSFSQPTRPWFEQGSNWDPDDVADDLGRS